jgi:hypothetical protein
LAAFAAYGGHGTAASSTIVYEIEPGGRLGWHTDAASACRNDVIFAGRPGGNLCKSNFVPGTAKTVNRNGRPPH